jgi:hypothetical protein
VEVDAGDVKRRLGDLGGADREDVLGRDPRLVALDRVADRGALGGHLRGRVEPDQVGAKAQPDPRRRFQPLGDRRGAIELVPAVQGDPNALADRALEQRIVLHRPVQRDPRRIGARAKRRLQLAGAEDVAAQSLFGEDAPKREGGIRLDRRQQNELARPARREGGLEAAGVPAQLILGDDV